MTPELWERLKPLFHEAMNLAAKDRPAFIRQACGDDNELKQNLEQLVQAADEETQTLDSPPAQLFPAYRPRFTAGQVLLERFRIVRPIGRGGMGEVYEAEDLQLGRVALKTMGQSIAASSEAFGRFRQEVQLARKVSGPGVCRIHELYLLPAGEGHSATAFLTMEYLDGVTLSERLKNGRPLPLKDALRIALDICEGLRLVHAQGVIHRDLKSSNIMLCGDGATLRAVLMDFGLARDSGAGHDNSHKRGGKGSYDGTIPGVIMGTPAYMAPEQFEAKPVSPATDIYALGIVLYELVTGLHPYAAPTPVAAAARRAHHPALPSSLNRAIPRKWDRVIQRCLQYEPSDRFQSADEVARELRAGPVNFENLRQDRPWLFRGAVAILLSVVAWGCFSWWRHMQYYRPDAEALEYYNNGMVLIRQGNYAEATRVLQKALDRDGRYVMAHARMAEGSYDLDFQGVAQKELLIALLGRPRLPSLDQQYLDAIHATVTGDADAALEDYKRILDDLPGTGKSSGYVDLGMAYERAGDIPHALESYAQAGAEDKSNPAAYMHTGILESRLHHVKEGEQAFAQAQKIFAHEVDSFGRVGNPEGLAEVDYERGYAANDRGDAAAAEPLLQDALKGAIDISSVQLQIRVLTQLATTEFKVANDAQVEKYAQEAIKLARENHLDSWAANGLVRLASDRILLGKLAEAEEPLEEAMKILSQSPQPREQALANSTYASLMDQEHHPDKVEEPAQAALNYYRKNGFSEGATMAGVLLIRAKRDKGHYKEALDDGNALLALAAQSGLTGSRSLAEETVGSVYLAMERYPEALAHFQSARALANSATLRSYQEFHCGDTLRRLGEYAESEAMLQLSRSNPAPLHIADVDESHVESLMSLQQYAPALKLEKEMFARAPDEAHKRDELQEMALAESHLGMKKEALDSLATMASLEQGKSTLLETAQDKMVAAEVYLWLQMSSQAHDAATGAEAFFASTGQLDSELRSAYLAAAASRSLNDQGSYEAFSKKVIDIGDQLRQNWGPEIFQEYISRPDMRALSLRAAR
jgi:tetratricopeptide (TPR) repeat protein